MNLSAGESFVMNVKKDYISGIKGASNIVIQRPDLMKLLVQVHRATSIDKRELLSWLKKKFETHQ